MPTDENSSFSIPSSLFGPLREAFLLSSAAPFSFVSLPLSSPLPSQLQAPPAQFVPAPKKKSI